MILEHFISACKDSYKQNFLLLNEVPRHSKAADQFAEAGHLQYPVRCGHVGEEVHVVSEKDGLSIADGFQDGIFGNSVGFLFYFPDDGESYFYIPASMIIST